LLPRFSSATNRRKENEEDFMSRPAASHRAGLLLATAIAVTAIPLRALTTVTVTSLADDGPGTLRAAVAASYPTHTVTLNFAVSGTINLASPLLIPGNELNGSGSPFTIDGGGKITLSGGGHVRVVQVLPFTAITLSNLVIANGKADSGGGIANSGEITLNNVTFHNNSAVNGGAIIVNAGALSVYNSTFDGNSAVSTNIADLSTGSGGAIASRNDSYVFVVNSTFTNNHAVRGGALMYGAFYNAVFYNSTIAGNTATVAGGGLFLGLFPFAGGSIDLKNTIIAKNTGGNCATLETTPTWHDLGGNLSYPDNTCPGLVADPKLGPLANNGGPTQTMALLSGSVAIDHAIDCVGLSSTPLSTDQRGVPRPQGNACDSGAYEKSPIEFTGFFAPIANLPQVNSENAGRAIPIGFSLGGFLGMNVLAAGYPASRPVSCATGQPTGPLTPIDTPGKSGLEFDSFNNRYTIVWKTAKEWDGVCRQLVLRLTDGIDHTALFRY